MAISNDFTIDMSNNIHHSNVVYFYVRVKKVGFFSKIFKKST